MSCKKYQDALIDLAATDAEPTGNVLVHLNACASCRCYFEREQSLSASIDTGVRLDVNAPHPGALVQRIHARIVQESAPARNWAPRLAMASAAVTAVITLGVVAVPYRLHRIQPQTTERTSREAGTVTRGIPVSSGNRRDGASIAGSRRRFSTDFSLSPAVRVANRSEPEVVVPPDQQLLLAEYARTLQSRALLARSGALLLPAASGIEPIVMAANDTPELKVQPLPDLQSK